MLIPLGVAFIVALAASTVVALTLTPVLCSYMLSSDKATGMLNRQPWLAKNCETPTVGRLNGVCYTESGHCHHRSIIYFCRYISLHSRTRISSAFQ